MDAAGGVGGRLAPTVSVVLTVLNGEDHVARAIRSVLVQSLTDLELVIVDDGSRDATADVVRGFDDPRIRFLRSDVHRGRTSCLNEAVARARGELIAVQDADDLSFPDRLERQVDLLEREPRLDLVASRVLAVGQDGIVRGVIGKAGDHETLTSEPWRAIPLPHPAWCGRRSWFERHPYRGRLRCAEDAEVLYRAASSSSFAGAAAVLVAKIDRPLLARTLLHRRAAFFAAALADDLRARDWRRATRLVRRTGAAASRFVLEAGRYDGAWSPEPVDPSVLDRYRALRASVDEGALTPLRVR